MLTGTHDMPGGKLGASPSVVREVRAWRLPPQPSGVPRALPAPLVAALGRPPAGPAWAEHRSRFAVELVGNGFSGWYAPLGETALHAFVDGLAEGLIGHDAAQPRCLPYRPRPGRHHTGAHARRAASAAELACWDLVSRASGRTVTALLGGAVRTTVPAYASALGLDPAHPAASDAATWIHDAGFWGQKWPLTKELISAGPREVALVLGRLRAAIGDARLMVDALGRCRLDEALRLLPVLADLQVAFAEDLLPSGSQGLHRLRASGCMVPLAAGENAVDTAEQVRLLTCDQVDVWQVDPAWSGGLARSVHTTDLAADLGVATFPHGDHLPACVALAGASCRDKVPAVEWHLTLTPLRQDVLTEPLDLHDGLLHVRDRIGLAGPPVLADARPVVEVTSP